MARSDEYKVALAANHVDVWMWPAKGPLQVNERHPYLQRNKPMILAHRGDSLHAPANTKPAFARAATCGADALETDIHWTQDGHIVVCHDETVDSVSNGTGAIKDMSLSALRELDFGYRFTPDEGQTFPYRGTGVQIMTLEEVLTAFPNIRVNMDIKPRQPGSLRQLVRLIHDCHAEWRVLLASFHTQSLRRIREMAPRLVTSASTLEVAQFWLSARIRIHRSEGLPYEALQVPVKMNGLQVVTAGFVRAAHQASTDVHVWTVDKAEEMKELLSLGVDGLVSNDPALAVQVRDTMNRGNEEAAGGSNGNSKTQLS